MDVQDEQDKNPLTVIPAQAGIHEPFQVALCYASRLRGNDRLGVILFILYIHVKQGF